MATYSEQRKQVEIRGQLSLQQKLVAAGGASCASALVVNPLDVVKTRMQAQAASGFKHFNQPTLQPLLDKWAIAGCPEACPRMVMPRASSATCGVDCPVYGSTIEGMRKIIRQEGARVLWRGTDVSLLMAVPMVGIYLPLYDSLNAQWATSLGAAAPLYAGALARTVAVLCTSPLELIRTRMQAVPHPQQSKGIVGSKPNMWSHLKLDKSASVSHRVRTLWTGVGATLARDVPFSAIYWGLLEPIRGSLLPADGGPAARSQTLTANLVAGTLAGGAAAAVTTPLDVVKTRAQLEHSTGSSVVQTLKHIARDDGVRGLFTGVGPRAVRAAPACAIVVASYEVIKSVYADS